MTDITLLVAQTSATLTTVMGLIALVMTLITIRKLASDSYRGFIIKSLLFFLIALIGVTAMTIYHYMEGLGGEIGLLEFLWYGFMFLALVFSLYVSSDIASFGRKLQNLKLKNLKVTKFPKTSKKSKRKSKRK